MGCKVLWTAIRFGLDDATCCLTFSGAMNQHLADAFAGDR
jgi:hypothetical protein